MLHRKKQLFGKIESVEGTAETLAAADGKLLVYDQKVEHDIQRFKQNPIRSSLSKIKQITGKISAQLSFSLPLAGSGSVSTSPEWAKFWRACGCQSNALYAIAIGAITSGPFLHGETITGGTSGATGRVIKNTTTGTTPIRFVSLTGTFQSGEVLTGGTSGATATTSGTPSQLGTVIQPYSEGHPTMTIASYEGGSTSASGLRKLLRGCRGSLKLALKNGEPAMNSFTFMGVNAGVTDAVFISGVSPVTTTAPVFFNGVVTAGGTNMGITELEFDNGAQLSPDEDVSGSYNGIKSFVIPDRDAAGSFNPKSELVATHDFYGYLFNGTEKELVVSWGTTAGNKFELYGPKVQYNKIAPEDRDGQMVERVAFDFNGSLALSDDEWCLQCL